MHVLPEIQTRFHAAMIAATPDARSHGELLELLEGDGQSIHRRVLAYRRNVFANLCNALALTYPLVRKIIGEQLFIEVVRCHVLTHPSLSGDLNEYGGTFADFLSDYPEAQAMPYLADVARLEWQMQTLLLAADPSSPGDNPFEALATASPEYYDQLIFQLDPANVRLNSAWPLFDIWRVNQPDYDGDMRVDFTKGSQLLIWRQDAQTRLAELDAGEAALLDGLMGGQTLAPATHAALTVHPDFDLSATLQRWIAAGLVRGVRTF